MGTLHFAEGDAQKLQQYLPASSTPDPSPQSRPWVTLTYATSLDASLAVAPGVRTALSGPRSQAMTHYLRSRHAAICVGVGTVEADGPGLNCRLATKTGSGPRHPRPVIIDPRARWALSEESKVIRLARAGQGLAPFVITTQMTPRRERVELLQRYGGKYIFVPLDELDTDGRIPWTVILQEIRNEGLLSVMIEGGGQVINSLLSVPNNELVDSVVLTIAPKWLGQGGVVASPVRAAHEGGCLTEVARLKDVEWIPLGEDIVLCGNIGR
jgi:2,5-diamino-6-(ribosylamino)-4(3H)-pyrimidinone 5'-phosphate reductase